MRNLLFLPFLLLLCAGCKTLKPTATKSPVRIIEVEYGLCKTDLVRKEPSDSSPNHNHLVVTNFRLLRKTDTIPAILDTEFGLKYRVECTENKPEKVTVLWTFPSVITNARGEKFDHLTRIREVRNGDERIALYRFESDFEMVKGPWKLEIFHAGKVLYRRVFHVQ